MRYKLNKKNTMLVLALLIVFFPSLFDYLYFSYLRGKESRCETMNSPDESYILEFCNLKTRRLLEFSYNTWIDDVRVIEKSTGNVIHEGTLFDADYVSHPPEWIACADIDEKRRPKEWEANAICYVSWALPMGACTNWDENNYSAYLPPALGTSREPVSLETKIYLPWTAYQRMFGC